MRRWMFAGTAALCLLALPSATPWAAEGSPERDRWYLEGQGTAPSLEFAPVVVPGGVSPERDRWYLEP